MPEVRSVRWCPGRQPANPLRIFYPAGDKRTTCRVETGNLEKAGYPQKKSRLPGNYARGVEAPGLKVRSWIGFEARAIGRRGGGAGFHFQIEGLSVQDEGPASSFSKES